MWRRVIRWAIIHAVFVLAVVIFYPFFTHARENARGASATSNRKQLAAAVTMFTGNIDDNTRYDRKKLPTFNTILGFTTNEFPLITGSTSTSPMEPYIIEGVLGLHREAYFDTSGNKTYGFPLATNPSRITAYNELLSLNGHIGTHEAYISLIKRSSAEPSAFVSDLALIARKPSADELKQAKSMGMEFDYRPIARDAFVFIVNCNNPVKALTLEQIRGIYTKRINNWKELGGTPHEIVAYSRESNSGSQELMKELVMGNKKFTRDEYVVMTMSGPIDGVSDDPQALAYSVYYYEEMMDKRPEIALVSINGVRPSKQTIANRTYPLSSDVYLVTRKGISPDTPAAKLRDWLLSPAGQKAVAQSGYIPILPVGADY